MSGVPKVTVPLQNGAIGALVASLDGVAALMLSGAATVDLALATPFVGYSLKDFENIGITEAGTNSFAWRQIDEFYAGYNYITGTERAELHIMLVAPTMLLEEMADKDEASGAKKLLDAAKGRVRLLGICRNPDVSYTPVIVDGIDPDSLNALATAQILANTMKTAQKPLRVLVEARAFEVANIGDLEDLATVDYNRAGLVIGSTKDDGSASVGLALGVAAALPVHRNIGRVLNGPLLPVSAAYIGDTAVEDMEAYFDVLHDKRYIFMLTMPNDEGYYFNDDPMACDPTDDFAQLYRGRTIDKMDRIACATYNKSLKDDVDTVEGGKLAAGVIAYMESRIDTEINLNMAGELSNSNPGDRHGFIDPDQNVATTQKVVIVVKGRPKAHLKDIEVPLGFEL